MRLSLESARNSLKQIVASFPSTPVQEIEYVKAIWQTFGWMDGARFDRVCKEVALEMKAGRLPVPRVFKAMYDKLNAQYGWSKQDRENLPKCGACRGTGFIYGHYRHRVTEEKIEAVKPCPVCRGESELKADLTPIGAEDEDLDMVRKMTPAGARWVLQKIEAGRVKYRDAVIIALMERAGGYDGPVEPTPMSEAADALIDAIKPIDKPPATVPPAVAHIPEAERNRLEELASKEDIPF